MRLLLNEARLARIVEQNARFPKEFMALNEYFEMIKKRIRVRQNVKNELLSAIQQKIVTATERLFFNRLLQLAADKKGNQEVTASATFILKRYFETMYFTDSDLNNNYLKTQWEQFLQNPNDFKAPPPPIVPPGQPIGCDFEGGY